MEEKNKTLLQALDRAIAFSESDRSSRLKRRFLKTAEIGLTSRFLHATHGMISLILPGETFWGKKISIPVPDALSVWEWGFIGGEAEIGLTKFFIRTLEAGNVFVDIGSHLGFYALLASELVGETGKVFAFEPTPGTYAILRKNISGLANVSSRNAGVWEKTTSMEFFDFGPLFGAFNSFKETTPDAGVNQRVASTKRKLNIPAVSLDDFCDREKITRLDVLQIDAERSEEFILRGGSAAIKKFHPAICVELFGKNWRDTDDRILAVLDKLGYSLFSPGPDGMLKPFDSSNRDFIQKNLVCLYGHRS